MNDTGTARRDDIWELLYPSMEVMGYRVWDLHKRLKKLEDSPFGKPPGLQDSDYRELYHDLLMQVGDKYPDETRHETAKRYIRQAEEYVGDDCGDMGGKTETSTRWRGGMNNI